ncbi:putative class B secretin-like G-protein coupled receptor GPRmth5 [Penaeus vannamei]|uniref:Putative class B secretin-like G-protein coupled receptor GPRmth5 n=1 Tax=Penaeus vannamei TaxID=6689 RepID=A0A3R7NRM0_PENVA|nr:uncharacterized protein LOC113821089 [Penaeus vannamei]ROT64854.1 putative class B secretin-like G-protein coupled receptor GPRmth5 [Penaeus vannamei]
MKPSDICTLLHVNLWWALAVCISFSRGEDAAANPLLRSLECSQEETHSCRQGNVTSTSWFGRGCFCDDLCGEYGDCCYDAEKDVDLGPASEAGRHRCVSLVRDKGRYMRASCPSGWVDEEVAALCRAASPEQMSFREDPLLHVPVTSRTSNVTYANYQCAVCHSDTHDVVFWNVDLKCPSLIGPSEVEVNASPGDLVFREGQWGVVVNGSEQVHICYLELSLGNIWKFPGRSCRLVVDKCMENWDDEREKLCHSYTSHVYINGEVYKNSFCATCNNASSTNGVCEPWNYSYPVFRSSFPKPFTILIDFTCRNGNNNVGERCVFDPFSKKYRNLGEIDVKEDLIHPDTPGNATAPLLSDGTCRNETILKDDYIMVNDTVVIKVSNRTYYSGEYEVVEEGVLVCSFASDKYSDAMGWVTLAGLSASSLCLVLHLVAFALVPHLRNLHGRNVASLSASLLGAYVSYILSVFAETSTTECYVFAVLIYYLFLTSFSWMNVLGFDVFYTFRRSRVRSGEQWKRFLVYSAYGWVLPACAVAAVVAVDQTRPPGFPPEFLPSLGQHLCWFGRRKALLAFFGAPLIASIIMNVALFVATTVSIAKTMQSEVRKTSPSEPKKEFLLYLRLAVLMGITWITSVVASYLELEVLWYVFILLNTLQGVFIFLALPAGPRCGRPSRSLAKRRPPSAAAEGKSQNLRRVIRAECSPALPRRT